MPVGRAHDCLGVVAPPVVNDLVVSSTAEAVALQELVATERVELLHRGEHCIATGEVGKRHGANLPNVRIAASAAPGRHNPWASDLGGHVETRVRAPLRPTVPLRYWEASLLPRVEFVEPGLQTVASVVAPASCAAPAQRSPGPRGGLTRGRATGRLPNYRA